MCVYSLVVLEDRLELPTPGSSDLSYYTLVATPTAALAAKN